MTVTIIVEKRIHTLDILTMNTCTNSWVGNLKDNYIPLLTEFQVCAVSYRPNFFCSDL